MEELSKDKPVLPLTDEQKIKRRTFISFTAFVGLNAAAYGAWRWLRNSPKETPGITAAAQKPLRVALDQTELAFRKVYSPNNLVKTYPKSAAVKNVRKNGFIGLKSPLNHSDWKLQVKQQSGSLLAVSLEEIKALPKTELVFDFKCVEGWDQVQHWGGVRFIDFVHHFKLDQEAAQKYVGMETPDKKYYIGIDIESALHPQTILAYEMNGKPLMDLHGAPLRLIIPVKYGIKSLKRIGKIAFSNERLPDYWAEQGYDYYSGL